MLAKTFLALVVLVGLTGAAHAGPMDKKGEESLTIDLSAVGAPTYYLKCSGASLASCGFVSVYAQSNILDGLQTSNYITGGRVIDPDSLVLG